MAKKVPDSSNRFRRTWEHAKEQGVSRKVLADSLGISQRRLSNLIAGNERATLGETHSLVGRRGTSLVRYKDKSGQRHSFYTGRGMSLERLLEQNAMNEIADEIASVNDYDEIDAFIIIENRFPKHPVGQKIYATNRTLRNELGGARRYR